MCVGGVWAGSSVSFAVSRDKLASEQNHPNTGVSSEAYLAGKFMCHQGEPVAGAFLSQVLKKGHQQTPFRKASY